MVTRMGIDPIGKFSLNVESITAYLEQMDVCFKVNKTELYFRKNPLAPKSSWIKCSEKHVRYFHQLSCEHILFHPLALFYPLAFSSSVLFTSLFSSFSWYD